jgi:hypothetical protein
MTIAVGPNIGEQLAAAEVRAGHGIAVVDPPALVQARAVPVPVPVRTDQALRLVGIEFVPKLAGAITLDGGLLHVGRIMIGPEAKMALSDTPMDRTRFLSQIVVRPLTLNPFKIDDKTHHVTRGSIVADTIPVYLCKACGVELELTQSQIKRVQNSRDAFKPVCKSCKAEEYPSRKHVQPMRIGAGSKEADQLFDVFRSASTEPPEATVHLMPRAWGVYPAQRAPTDWMPDASDTKAMDIAQRLRKHKRVIRPLAHVLDSQPHALIGIYIEATRCSDGTAGMEVGWLSRGVLQGTDTPPEYRYTVRGLPRNTQPRQKRMYMV